MAHYYVKILKPKQYVSLPIKFVQIEALPDETNHTNVLNGLSWPKLSKLVSIGIYTRQPRFQHSLHTLPQILHSQIMFWTHAPPWKPCHPIIYVSPKYGPQTILHTPSWATLFLASPPRAITQCHAPPMRLRILIMSCWRHYAMSVTCKHATSSVTQAPSLSAPRHRMTSASLQPIYDLTQKPRIDPNYITHWLCLTVDFTRSLTLTLCWPLTKSQIFQKGLSYLIFHVVSDFGHHFFIWSSEIGQLAYSSLWFLQRYSSRHFQGIFSCLSNLNLLSSFSPWVWGRVLEIY